MTNIVRHSRGVGAASTLTTRMEPDRDAFVIVLEDDGGAFDPRTVPSPPVATRLEDAATGGRGIALVREFADDVAYERDGPVNRVRLIFRADGTHR